jgi:PAS domain S-box-containing protein
MQRPGNWIRQRPDSPLNNPGATRTVSHGISLLLTAIDRLLPASLAPVGGPIAIILICLLATLNFIFVPPIDFSVFYLVLIAFATWTSGRSTGLLSCAFGFTALLTNHLHRLDAHAPISPMIWNLVLQTGIYLFATLSVSSVRDWIEELKQRARERTASLEREVDERRQTEEQLRKTMQQLRQLSEHITDAFWMRNVGDPRLVYVSPAYETIWGRSCKDLYPSPSGWLDAVHPEDRERVAQAITNQSANEHGEEYRIVRPDGTLRWIRDRAYPIRDNAGSVIRIVGIAEDITDRRRMEDEILAISDREQARLGQDLHDSLCQKLVSAAFDNSALKRRLASRELPEAALVQQIAVVLDDAITEARTLARGLFPVQLEADGLHVALQQLTTGIQSRFQIECRAHCDESVIISDNAFATHLYRIIQEAVTNAVKHSKANRILVDLSAAGGFIELTVSDDGVGMPPVGNKTGGMGLHTMEYRARTIGGILKISPAPGGGTIVSCRVPQRPV